jgi:hypothetical protein
MTSSKLSNTSDNMIQQNQLDALDGARYIAFDITNGYIIVWKGTSAVNVYRASDYQMVAHWNIEFYTARDGTNLNYEQIFDIVKQNVKQHVAENNYPY